ncbi:hypothetical protein EMEDMD4_300061 [Sinorhizobium medicae]|uniref:Uncharacterized protein n=1 Tax=Sinorhizobium medicae TaxID=110321 RepID=A0A508WWM1_9HYPH|nr:hypothetical protein EMEDMD4_300061 [Sinorhizobium medicae]
MRGDLTTREKGSPGEPASLFMVYSDVPALSGGFGSLLDDLTTQQASAHAEFGLVGLQQEGVEAAAVFDRAESRSGNAQAEALAESIGNQRDVAQVREELALGLVVGMADIVARLDALAGQFATTGHGTPILLSPPDNAVAGLEPRPRSCWPLLESRGSIVTGGSPVKSILRIPWRMRQFRLSFRV